MRQNDLIRAFSMQVHHEYFFISANGFFQINLNLLSSVSNETLLNIILTTHS